MITIDRIRELLKEQGRSQKFLCDILGLKSRSFFSNVESGKTSITPERLLLIADALNTTPEYLNGETDIKEKPTDQPVDEQLKRAALAMSRLSPQSREKALSYMDYLLANQEDNQ